jgi:hypothetical protein
VLGLCAVAAALLAGCTTTQQKSARAKVVANRLLAARKPLVVRHANPDVVVVRSVLVRGGRDAAVLVRLRNRSSHVVEDLPINVGLRVPRRRTVWLNRRGGGDYLRTHVAAIPARDDATWILTVGRRAPARARVLARVGVQPAGEPRPVSNTPALRASAHGVSRHAVLADVANRSAIPQYGLGVYAYATRAGRVVAAGRAVVKHLGTGGRESLRIPLVGRPHGAVVTLALAPTTLR